MASTTAVVSATQAVGSIGSSYAQYKAQKTQGEYQKTMSEINASFAEREAREAVRSGNKTASQIISEAERITGTQKARLAAQGIDIDVGSAVDIQEDARQQAEVAAMQVKNNAWRAAWGLKQEARLGIYQGNMAKNTADNLARSTLLTGGLNTLTYAYQGISSYTQNRSTTDKKGS